MTRPTTYLIRMLIFLAAVMAVGIVLIPKLRIFFASNPALNAFIFFVLLLGILWNLRQVLRLEPEVSPGVGDYQRTRPAPLRPDAAEAAGANGPHARFPAPKPSDEKAASRSPPRPIGACSTASAAASMKAASSPATPPR